MSDELRTWVAQELDRRRWSHRELARQTGLSQSFVSKTLSGERSPSVNFCNKVAKALDESPEKLLRMAGILPKIPANDDSFLQEMTELTRNLPQEDKQQVLEYIRFIYQQRKG